MYITCIPGTQEKGFGSSGTGVTDGCESPCGSWESNLDPLEEQLVLLTVVFSLQDPPSRFLLLNDGIMLVSGAHLEHIPDGQPCAAFLPTS